MVIYWFFNFFNFFLSIHSYLFRSLRLPSQSFFDHRRPSIAQQLQESLDGCSTSGGQSRVRAPIDWSSSTRSELDLVVERRSRKSTPVVRDLSLLLPVSSERKSFSPRDRCRNPLLVTTGKYHPSDDFCKSIVVAMRGRQWFEFSFLVLLLIHLFPLFWARFSFLLLEFFRSNWEY